jgi:hypothetical protein
MLTINIQGDRKSGGKDLSRSPNFITSENGS